ncbi:MAG: histidine kinase [Lachnospiraceae bacterium]|nr:histidine kinase [Lachnospiraceae bacterium]
MKKRALRLTIRQKFYILNGIFLIMLIIIFVAAFKEVRRSIEETTIASEGVLLGQTSNTIELLAEEAQTIAGSIASQPLLYRMVNSRDLNLFLEENDTAVYARDFFSEIETVTKSEMFSSIHIYLAPKYEAVEKAYEFAGVFRPVSDIMGSYWYGIFAGKPLLYSLFCPDFYLTHREIGSFGSPAYIQRLTLTGQQTDEVGYIAVYFKPGYIRQILETNEPGEGSVYYIVNSRQSTVASTDEELSGRYHMDYEVIPEIIGIREEYRQTVISGERMYLAYNNIANTDWRLVSGIPVSSIHAREQGRMIRQFGLLLLLFAATVIIQIIISRNISSRIIRVSQQMNKDPDAPLAKLAADESGDEIGQLVDTYNQMVDRISFLVASERETADRLKVSEVNALQSQINPHFLYNMLDMINWQAKKGNSEAVSRAVQSLSRFYRLVLSSRGILIPVRDELRHVELYIELQNMRYEDKVNFIIDVPDELMDCKIPKLVLQPMVENSLIHGIFEKESPSGTVVIMAWEEINEGTGRDDVVITVSDDGAGIDDDKLADLKRVLSLAAKGIKPDESEDEAGSGSYVAVYNTEQRLNLLFGPEYGLTYRRNEPEGTEVEIRIPRLLEDRMDMSGRS